MRPTGWRSVAASAAQIFPKNTDLVREAVNCNAVLGCAHATGIDMHLLWLSSAIAVIIL